MTDIHAHYNKLTIQERSWVDDIFAEIMATPVGQGDYTRPPLAADDRIERAVDALSRAVIESREITS